MVPIDQSQLIPYFAQLYLAAQRALDKADRASALRAYQQLLDVYRQMEAANVEDIHRELAHDQLTQLFDTLSNNQVTRPEVAQQVSQVAPAQPAPQYPQQIQQPAQQPLWQSTPEPLASAPRSIAPPVQIQQPASAKFSSREILLISIFVALIGVVVFVKPEFIGLATLDNSVTLPVETTFTQSGSFDLKLGAAPFSLKLTGQMSGDGNARVYYDSPQGRKLVFDSTLTKVESRNGIRYFDGACIDTCAVQGKPDVTLHIELENSALTIDSVTYTAHPLINSPPKWIGSSDSLPVSRGIPTAIDLSQLFSDPDGNSLGFIATSAPGLGVNVEGSLVTFTADHAGTYDITLIASDGQAVTRVPYKIQVQ